MLIGEAMEWYKLSIANGATVTLRNVTIDGENDDAFEFAGITCEGNATIILEGTNSVCGFDEHYPGIYVPVDKTLTIEGSGKLTASSNRYGAGIGGAIDLSCGNIIINSGTIVAEGGYACAAIGGGYEVHNASVTCGNITINGGDITATCRADAAAIGSGSDENASCGNITITGGTVRATNATGGNGGSGIGSGSHGHCGDILISGGTIIASGGKWSPAIGSCGEGSCGTITITNDNNQTSVSATKGNDGLYCIGKGDENSTFGTITIGGTEYYNGTSNTWTSTDLENALKAATFTWPSAQ